MNIWKLLYILERLLSLIELVLQLGLLWVMSIYKWKTSLVQYKLIEMLYKLILKISELGMGLDRLISFRIWIIMLYITLAELFCQDQKMQECGMLWEVAMKKLERQSKPKNVMKELNVRKIDRELQYIKWQNYIIQWAHSFN